MRKPVFRVTGQVIPKPPCSATENRKLQFHSSKFRYDTFQNAKNNGADQTGDVQAGLQAGLCLCCSQTTEDRFSRVEAHLMFNKFVHCIENVGSHKKMFTA